MLRAHRIGLRARHETDIPILHAELYDDIVIQARSSGRPWLPISAAAPAAPFRVDDAAQTAACFSVVNLADDALAGEAVLWGIDLHNRMAHVGLGLLPQFRGRGLGTDVVRALCVYGFTVRGLHRLQLETLADNDAMRAAASRVGFSHEGTMRQAAWVSGQFVDEVVYALLAADWDPSATEPARAGV